MNDPQRDELHHTAMKIILHAGDARVSLRTGYEAIAAQDFAKAQEVFADAKADITRAHKAQTELIQAEARGERQELSLLFNHAQDTLMTVNSEWVTATNLLNVFQALINRLDTIDALLRGQEADDER